MSALTPYLSVFTGRLEVTLQYRAAAFAGFITQCWFGIIRILIFAAFYAGGAPAAPGMVRSGAIAYERLRPVDTYAWWYARALAWSLARVAPRAVLMVAFAS